MRAEPMIKASLAAMDDEARKTIVAEVAELHEDKTFRELLSAIKNRYADIFTRLRDSRAPDAGEGTAKTGIRGSGFVAMDEDARRIIVAEVAALREDGAFQELLSSMRSRYAGILAALREAEKQRHQGGKTPTVASPLIEFWEDQDDVPDAEIELSWGSETRANEPQARLGVSTQPA